MNLAARRRSTRVSAPALAALTTAVALTAAGCSSGGPTAPSPSAAPSGAAPGPVGVVATTDVYGSVAGAIGGRNVAVTSIIHSPDADPHEYESTPADASAVNSAKLLIANGGGYDDFAGKLVDAASTKPTVIDVSQLSGLDTGDDFNEHVFYSLPTMAKLADTINTDLAKADPAHASEYQANTATFKNGLEGLSGKLAAIKSAHDGAKIAITEPVPLYLTEQAGLVNATPPDFSKAIEEGNDPPAAVVQQTLAQFSGPAKVSALLLNGQAESPVTQQVKQAADGNQVPVVTVTETLPAGVTDYATWMGGEIDQLASALGSAR